MDKSEIRKRKMDPQEPPSQAELEKLFDGYFRHCHGKSDGFQILVKTIKYARWKKFEYKKMMEEKKK